LLLFDLKDGNLVKQFGNGNGNLYEHN
jgi:hypothetical protein